MHVRLTRGHGHGIQYARSLRHSTQAAARRRSLPSFVSRSSSSVAGSVTPDRFEQRVVEAINEEFPQNKAARVVDSLMNYVNGERLEQGMQSAGTFIRGLDAKAWHDPKDFPWLVKLAEAHEEITAELDTVLADAEAAERKGTAVWAKAARAEAVAYGPNWRTLVLQDRGRWEPSNTQLFPKTTALLKKLKVPSSEVFLARQAPDTGIAAHTDECNYVLTAHVALRAPEGGLARMRVGDEWRPWVTGEACVFDGSFEHETHNGGEEDRHVIILRFFHPEITATERSALRLLFDCVDARGDAPDADVVRAARRALRARRKKTASKSKKASAGFG